MVRHLQYEPRTKAEVRCEVMKRNERTSINNPGAEMRVKYGYTVILGVMARGNEHGSSTKIQNTEPDSAEHNHLYFHYTFICTSHIKVFRTVLASFVRIIDAGCIAPLLQYGSLTLRFKLNKYRNTHFKTLYKNTQNVNYIRFTSIFITERISILYLL